MEINFLHIFALCTLQDPRSHYPSYEINTVLICHRAQEFWQRFVNVAIDEITGFLCDNLIC